jgi:hypothetical protein
LLDLPDNLDGHMSSHLFTVKESFAAALDSKLDNWTVRTTNGDTDKGQEFMKRLEEWKDHDFMVNMPWREAGNAAIAAASVLSAMKLSIKQWKVPMDVAAKRNEFDAAAKEFDAAVLGLEDYCVSADRLEAQEKSAAQMAKDLKSGIVNRYYGQLLRERIPKAIAKVGSLKRV